MRRSGSPARYAVVATALCAAYVIVAFGVGLVRAADVVEVDLSARMLKASLPFDIPFYIKGNVGNSVYEVRAWYWEIPDELRDAPPNLLRQKFEEASRAKKDEGSSPVDTLGPWTRIKGVDANEFFVAVPALEARKRYWFDFEVLRELTGDERNAICSTFVDAVDWTMRDTATTIDFKKLHQTILEGLPTFRDGKLQWEDGSLFSEEDVSPDKLKQRLEQAADLVEPQSQRKNILIGLHSDSVLVVDAVEALAKLGESRELAAVVAALQSGDPQAAGKEALAIAELVRALTPFAAEEVGLGYRTIAPGQNGPPRPSLRLGGAWKPKDVEPFLTNLQTTYENLKKLRWFVTEPGGDRNLLSGLSSKDRQEVAGLANEAAEVIGDVHFEMVRLERVLTKRTRILAEVERDCGRMAATDIHIMGSTTADFETRAKQYISADFGICYTTDIEEFFTYAGVNIYLRPVNKKVPLGDRGGPGRRFALMLGLTFTSVEEEGERAGVLGNSGLLAGVGYRLTDQIRASVGALFFRAVEPDPAGSDAKLSGRAFLSLSFDWDIKGTLGAFGNFLKS